MRKLKWNEEYYLKYTLCGSNYRTPIGKGYIVQFEVDDEIKRLREKGATNIKSGIRIWN